MDAKEGIIKFITSPYLWFFFIIMFGLWLFCWGFWGGSITVKTVPKLEAGLGLNP